MRPSNPREAVSGDGGATSEVLSGMVARTSPRVTMKHAPGETGEVHRCSCGNDRSRPRLTVEARHRWDAGFFFVLGISAPVKEVASYCEKWGTVMKRTRDSEILRKYRRHAYNEFPSQRRELDEY